MLMQEFNRESNTICSKSNDVEVTSYQTDYKKIIVTKKINLITPFMDKILGNPYLLEVERIVPNE